MSRVPLVDVSEHQGHIDWDKMLAAGVGHVIIRAGINGRLDKRIDEYVTGARAAGIDIPALYWFVNPNSVASAERQAELAAGACHRYDVRTLMYDLESYASESPKPALPGGPYMAWLERMDAAVAAAELNRIAYTNASYWNPLYVGVGSSLTDLDLIVATYPHYSATGAPGVVDGYPPDRWEERAFWAASKGPLIPAGFDQWDGWQFSAGFNRQGPVYGCSSRDLDLNIIDEDALARWRGDHIDPQEDFMSDAQYAAVMDAIAAMKARQDSIEGGIGRLLLAIEGPDAIQGALGIRWPQLAQVVAAAVEAKPGGTGGLSKQDVEAIINATSLVTG